LKKVWWLATVTTQSYSLEFFINLVLWLYFIISTQKIVKQRTKKLFILLLILESKYRWANEIIERNKKKKTQIYKLKVKTTVIWQIQKKQAVSLQTTNCNKSSSIVSARSCQCCRQDRSRPKTDVKTRKFESHNRGDFR